ncbi:hypothetical protein BG015_002608, partial [Linnemannia schmuckeri]
AQPKKTTAQQPDVPELDADFLAALPQDIRAEVEAAHRVELIKNRRRQEAELAAQKDAASAASRHGSGASSGSNEQQGGPVLERPTLMGKWEIGDLRVMLTQWVQSTLVEQELSRDSRKKDEAKKGGGGSGGTETVVFDEGPNPDDVQSFVDFVARVIVMERDLERVRLLLRYLWRRIEDNERQVEPQLREVAKGGRKPVVGVAMTWRQAFEWVFSVTKQLVVHIYGGSFDLD